MSWDNNWGGSGGDATATATDSWGGGGGDATVTDSWGTNNGDARDSFGAENGGNEDAGNAGGDRACFNCGETGLVFCLFKRPVTQTNATDTVL